MQTATTFETTLLGGAERLLRSHAAELPQRDDLCGAFCAALALHAAGIERRGGEPLDQDAVALAAGTVVSATPNVEILPSGEQGRRDYRISLPAIEDGALSGTTAAGLVSALGELSDGRLVALPYDSPWTAANLAAIFDLAASLTHPVTLLANFATRHLWGSRPAPGELVDYLLHGVLEGPAPDWDVGHFACVVGRIAGPRGSLYCIVDTYPSLGRAGVHLQPEERLARAIERRDMPAGGVIVVIAAEDEAAVRSGAASIGLHEGVWDNGTPAAEFVS
ncbi:MAG TPA: hypothetical protein VHY83_13145 [Solirubrobacteraceae bacterium]|nr:hypothetical protein [Solirubrobacteraceae bacterium]